MAVVALLQAEAGSTPTGTGSFSYFTNFQVVIENIAFVKDVGIWGHNTTSGTWGLFSCHYDHSVPNNNEIWQAHVDAIEVDAFDVRYQVAGNTYWDNNGGFNYCAGYRSSTYRRYRHGGSRPERAGSCVERRSRWNAECRSAGEEPSLRQASGYCLYVERLADF